MKSLPDMCRINPVLEVLVGKWKSTILLHLYFEGTKRFSELQKAIPDITKKMLTSQLRELEDQDVVRRVVYPVVPPKVEYSLTDYGYTLGPILRLMNEWGTAHDIRMRNKQMELQTVSE